MCILTHCWVETGILILCHKHYLAKGHYLKQKDFPLVLTARDLGL